VCWRKVWTNRPIFRAEWVWFHCARPLHLQIEQRTVVVVPSNTTMRAWKQSQRVFGFLPNAADDRTGIWTSDAARITLCEDPENTAVRVEIVLSRISDRIQRYLMRYTAVPADELGYIGVMWTRSEWS
jgi:hypothetical protein